MALITRLYLKTDAAVILILQVEIWGKCLSACCYCSSCFSWKHPWDHVEPLGLTRLRLDLVSADISMFPVSSLPLEIVKVLLRDGPLAQIKIRTSAINSSVHKQLLEQLLKKYQHHTRV